MLILRNDFSDNRPAHLNRKTKQNIAIDVKKFSKIFSIERFGFFPSSLFLFRFFFYTNASVRKSLMRLFSAVCVRESQTIENTNRLKCRNGNTHIFLFALIVIVIPLYFCTRLGQTDRALAQHRLFILTLALAVASRREC